jgi:hypothetical protein
MELYLNKYDELCHNLNIECDSQQMEMKGWPVNQYGKATE